ncbi:sodium-dependent transporter [Thermococcus sp. Bubb.Bath]|uniref:sodium-dependent transporter n=1 Tax=Thermococcus sp. Bubb.Bath TaxID=1638242 RepID=UPI001438F40D|nr:sodium-dependent transporter [Thermococcus sp. Bubb.Bath]NJF24131.1 hypothetical protein [Thermococcus sp. Bubb.Bath]
MRKMSILMALLITGYILGIWNFLLMPKYYLSFGLKGFLVSLIALGAGLLLIYGELEATKRSRYLIHEFFVKVSRSPAVTLLLLMFLLVSGGITLYYSSKALLPVFNISSSALLPIIWAVILFILIILVVLKGRSVEFIGALAVLFILFAIVATLAMRSEVYGFVKSQTALHYLNVHRSAIFSFHHGLTARGVVFMLVATLVSLGLGTGVYYVIGSFSPDDLDMKKLLTVVVILQIFLSFAAALTTAYSIGAAYQSYENSQAQFQKVNQELHKLFLSNINPNSEEFKSKFRELNQTLTRINQTLTDFHKVEAYASSSTGNPIKAIETFYLIPKILRESNLTGATTIIFLLMSSLFLAGFTSLVVLVEIGAQISSEVLQMKRGSSVTFVSLAIAVIGSIMMVSGIRTMLLTVPLSVGALVIAIEGLPLLRGVSPVNKSAVSIGVLLALLVGILGLVYTFKLGGIYIELGILLSLLMFTPLLFNGYLMGSARRGR